jgi:hypothetical protein
VCRAQSLHVRSISLHYRPKHHTKRAEVKHAENKRPPFPTTSFRNISHIISQAHLTIYNRNARRNERSSARKMCFFPNTSKNWEVQKSFLEIPNIMSVNIRSRPSKETNRHMANRIGTLQLLFIPKASKTKIPSSCQVFVFPVVTM